MDRKEIPSRMAVIVLITNQDYEILLIRQEIGKGDQKRDLWLFPGGRMEVGETFMDAAIREVKEETQLIVKPTTLLGLKNWFSKEKNSFEDVYHYGVDFYVGAEMVEGVLSPNTDERINKLEFMSLSQIGEIKNIVGGAYSLATRFIEGQGIPITANLTDTSQFDRYIACI